MNTLFAHVLALTLLATPLHAAQTTPDGSGGADLGAGATQQRAQTAPRADEADAARVQGNANRFVVGSLIDVRSIKIEGDDGYHRLLKLESQDGRHIIVDLGPAPAPSAFGFRRGDLLVAMGKSARINGHPVLYAYYIGGLFELSDDAVGASRNAPEAGR